MLRWLPDLSHGESFPPVTPAAPAPAGLHLPDAPSPGRARV